ncbi:MAG: DUF4339 domain-containing protein [Pirellulales bacterium]|nr:DUF4339 domain-containing protein [Pirellulales bacterium]
MARSHQLTPQDLVKKSADGRWVDANRVKGLFEEGATSSIIMAKLPPKMKKAAPDDPGQPKSDPATPARPVGWYYISAQDKIGPLSFEELQTHGERGLLKPTDRVWSTSSPKWSEAKDVKGLVFVRPAGE